MWLGNAPEYEPDTGGPDGTEDVSGSMVSASEGPQFGSAEGDGMPVPPMLQWSPEPVAAPAPAPQARQTSARKTKARTVYSSEQLRVLNNRFEVQKYLTPKEMEDLAKSIGLTYKQVKTWFQNNRMLLKRQQKDDSWMSERYMVRNPQRTPSQVIVPTLSQDQNSPGASSYLNSSRALSPSLGSPGPWGSWHVPPAVQHGEFLNSSGDVPVGGNAYNGNVMFVDPGSSSTQMAEVHSTTQWSF